MRIKYRTNCIACEQPIVSHDQMESHTVRTINRLRPTTSGFLPRARSFRALSQVGSQNAHTKDNTARYGATDLALSNQSGGSTNSSIQGAAAPVVHRGSVMFL